MQRLEISGAVRPIYGSLGVKRLIYLLPLALVTKGKISCPRRIVCHLVLTTALQSGVIETLSTGLLHILATCSIMGFPQNDWNLL